MALEDRIRSSVDTALNKVRTQLEQDAHSIVDQLISSVREEREEALSTLRQQSASELNAVRDQAASELSAVRSQAASELDALRHQSATELSTLRQHASTETERLVQEAKSQVEERERAADTARLSRLLEGIRGLDGARSLSEVLDALGHAASREASRAAVLIIRQERLTGWKLTGFGVQDAQPKAIDIGLADGGVLSTAALSARPATTRENRSGVEVPQFADLDPKPFGIAVPVGVGGRVVAVVYADAGSAEGLVDRAMRWKDAVEILARHAGRCLEGLTVQRSANAASPRFWVQAAGRGPATGTVAPNQPLVEPPPVAPHVNDPPGATP